MDIRTIVVDNTVELKEKLTKLLNEIPGVTVCQSFDDAVAAMQYVEEHPVDLVFSDVVMPEISGIILNPWNRTIQLDKTLLRIIKG